MQREKVEAVSDDPGPAPVRPYITQIDVLSYNNEICPIASCLFSRHVSPQLPPAVKSAPSPHAYSLRHMSLQLPPAVMAPAGQTPAAAGPGPSLHRPLPRDAQHVDAIAMAAAEQLVAACTAGRGLAPPSELQRRCRRQRQPPAPPLLGTNVRVARRPQAVPDHSACTYGCELAS